MDPSQLCLGKGLVLPNLNIDEVSLNTRFLIISLPNNEMSKVSPFAIQKALVGVGGEPKSVKRLHSGDLLIETNSALQTKSFLLAKSFLNSPVTISPHKTLNSCCGVISEADLLSTPEAEILEGFSNQGVIQVRRITIKKDSTRILTKHLILTFNSPILPTNIKAGYLNCRIRPYIPNPLRCFKCQRFGHSQTSCRGQLTCSRCASVGHASTDCNLEPKFTSTSKSKTSITLIDTAPTTSNNFFTSAAFSSSYKALSSSDVSLFTPLPAATCPAVETETSKTNTIPSTSQDAKQTSNSRKKRRHKKSITSKIDIQLTPHKPKKSTPLQDTSDEDMLIYDVEEEVESPKKLNSVGEIKKTFGRMVAD
ncbi:uncharacterized protein TNCV_2882391 [Trichonephila clavipes]|nr:uncharacterized protein TNCV_2882391 [Trichonephila clavipes]